MEGNFTYMLIAALAVAVLLWALFRRSGGDDGLLRSEVGSLKDELRKRDEELREARENSSRFDALATERRTEIDKLNGDLSKLRERLDAEVDEQRRMAEDQSRLEAQMEAERKASEEKIKMLAAIRNDMETKFRELAQEALKVQGTEFSKSNLEKLDAALMPLKKDVDRFGEQLRNVHEEAIKERERLKVGINRISEDAIALTRALKGDQQKQGAWGEMILENILERSGLREGEEYETQAHRTDAEGGRLRPDVVVRIPGGKTLVIDSKVSLTAYNDAVNAESEGDAATARARHLVSLRSHIDGLSGKGYQDAERSTVDYVILFVPIEGALAEALREDGNLTEYALERRITIATPTTLMMALRTVANVWAVERRNLNAENIARRAGKIYDKLAGFVGDMENVGKRLEQARSAYDSARGKLTTGRGNLLSQVENLKTMGAKATKSMRVEFDRDDGGAPQLEREERP